MADTKTPAKATAPFLPGSIIWQKKGPLPVWAWVLIGLTLLFVITWWRRNKQASDTSNEQLTGTYRDELPGDQGAPPIFVVPQAPVSPVTILPPPPPITVPPAPPGGGAPPPMQLPTMVEAPVNTNLYEWFTGQGTTFDAVDRWNPGWRSKNNSLQWYKNPDGSTNKIPKLSSPLVLKVR